jgi:BirA family transcriptional regulator, biotin operon repressor / biotin---[acetyl-CoA-carboxylase] ligase
MAKPFSGVSAVFRVASIDSTQDLARRLADQGAAHGTLIWADKQTQGRGQFSRRWSSPVGGLYISLILRPQGGPDELAGLSLTAARAAAKAIERLTGLEVAVKPPNDVYASARGRSGKVCGILVDSSSRGRMVEWLVVGLGLNVNNRAPLKTASSLKALTGREWNIEAVLRAILREFFDAE